MILLQLRHVGTLMNGRNETFVLHKASGPPRIRLHCHNHDESHQQGGATDMDFRTEKHNFSRINGMSVECVSSCRLLRPHVSGDLSWSDTSSRLPNASFFT